MVAAGRRVRWGSDRVAWAGAAITAVALALRVAHVLTSAKLLVADDAVFFEQHALAFAAAWQSVGTAAFGEQLREAIDHASLQGVVYPVFLSPIYALRGGVDHTAAAMAQALLGAATVWLTFATTRRAFGSVAAIASGAAAAIYAPLILTAGLLLAEAVLLFLQALASYWLVRGAGVRAGLSVGALMLRPAFQHAGLLTLIGLAAARGKVSLLIRYVGGLLVVALPWLAMNGIVFDRFVWSRTGDAWQQVYWGIYPPNRGWWPPDSPVPPKYGVESLPGARAAGRVIETRDLDYLEAALEQVRATPLQALATEVNKLAHGYLYPFNTYAEAPPLVAGLAVPLHRALVWLALVGAALAWRRRVAWGLAGLTLGVALPFLVSHIDVRYVIPVMLAALPFAGLAVAEGWRTLAERRAPSAAAVGALLGLGVSVALEVPVLVGIAPELEPLIAHRLRTALLAVALVTAGAAVGRWLGAQLALAALAAVAAGVVVVQALYDPSWHEWSTLLRPGERAAQRISLPAGWTPPPGARAEVRVYAAGSRAQSYTPVLFANGREVARLGPAFTDGGPLRFEERVMVAASRQGKVRAEVPQWYGLSLDVTLLSAGSVDLSVGLEGPTDAWIRMWGDYEPLPGARVLEAPAVHSRIQGQDDSFQKFVATGHGRIWRRYALTSTSTIARLERGGVSVSNDLSDSLGRQSGAFRIRVLVFSGSGELLAVF